ncbi:MAG: hypothetical protein IPH13_11480 [Planctomycetes bacterium]|nr:hypothetical protein [Planctomycetota bacterium]MCC7169189.1 hypothetical protein [Planctomycetota bacterium]
MTNVERTLPRTNRGPLAVLALLAVLGATSCGSSPDDTTPVRGDVEGPRPRLEFETVRSILHDSHGNTWFGSWNQGVALFDGTKLTTFTKQDGLSDDQIRSIHEDEHGVVWFEGGVGISGFDGERIIPASRRSYDAKDDWKLRADDLWFKEDGERGATALEARPGVYRYDGDTFHFVAYPIPDPGADAPAFATTCIARGKNGRMWFATYSAVIGFDGESFTIIDDQSLGFDSSTGRLHVRCVFEDSKGNLWIGNNWLGVLLYDGTTTRRFTQEMGLGKPSEYGGRTNPLPGDVAPDAPSMHRVFSIGEDRDGNIWFGTVESGAWRYDGKAMKHYAAAEGLTTKDVLCISQDRNGDLWLAGNDVFKFNGTSFDRIH